MHFLISNYYNQMIEKVVTTFFFFLTKMFFIAKTIARFKKYFREIFKREF